MTSDLRLVYERFPRSSQCDAKWDIQRTAFPDNSAEIKALEADRGRYLDYVRLVGRRQGKTKLGDYTVSVPTQYTKTPLLRSEG